MYLLATIPFEIMNSKVSSGPLSGILNPAPGSIEYIDENGLRYNAIKKHGRCFHTWKAGLHPFPCDQVGLRDSSLCDNR